MGQDMRGNIAAGALILGVATAVTVTAASEMGNPSLNKPAISSSRSPEATPSKTKEFKAPAFVVPSPSKTSKSPSPRLETATIRIKPVAYSKSVASTKAYAKAKVGATQFKCLNSLWTKESRWNYKARNPYSGAYGIPQALPGSKMASKGKDWRTNPRTQVNWGLSYIKARYKTSCGAWAAFKRKGWY